LIFPLLLPVRFGQYGDRFRLLLLQARIDARELRLRQLLEIADDIFEFVRQRVEARRLILRGPALVAVDGSVELAEQFANPLFARIARISANRPST